MRRRKGFLQIFILGIFSFGLVGLASFLIFEIHDLTFALNPPNPAFTSNTFYLKQKPVENISSTSTEDLKPIVFPDFLIVEEMFLEQKESFIEINLQEMKVRFYKQGSKDIEVDILRKGDPFSWGGTSSGLYNVKDKNRISFSIISEVYMPYSIHFYGKYYLHGEPYYPGGYSAVSDFSGGCVQLANKDAKSIFEKAEINMPVLVIDKLNDNYNFAYSSSKTKKPDISAEAYLAGDLGSGFIFLKKEIEEPLPIASLTKLMTAIVLSENIDLTRQILVTDNMLEAYGNTVSLVKGKVFKLVELFYPLLIESSNDAAEVLSYFLGKNKTIALMNEKAKAILMVNSTFVDVDGFSPENISSVQDLFYLARYILNNRPLFLEISKGKKVKSFGNVNFDIDNLWNKNIFIDDETFVGGKTGYIASSLYTALFIFRFKGKENTERNVAIILLGSYNLRADTQAIYRWLEENYFNEI